MDVLICSFIIIVSKNISKESHEESVQEQYMREIVKGLHGL